MNTSRLHLGESVECPMLRLSRLLETVRKGVQLMTVLLLEPLNSACRSCLMLTRTAFCGWRRRQARRGTRGRRRRGLQPLRHPDRRVGQHNGRRRVGRRGHALISSMPAMHGGMQPSNHKGGLVYFQRGRVAACEGNEVARGLNCTTGHAQTGQHPSAVLASGLTDWLCLAAS